MHRLFRAVPFLAGLVLASASLAAWPTSAETPVPLGLPAEQIVYPHGAPDGQGGVFLVWTDKRNEPDGDLYAQRVGADGTLLWGSGGIPVSTYDNGQFLPRVCADGAGGAFIVWEDQRDNMSIFIRDVYAQHLQPDGTASWATNGIRVSRPPLNTAWQPQLVLDGAGGVIVVWDEGTMRAQRVDAGGNRLWATDGIELSSSQPGLLPRVLADGNGGVWVAWVHDDSDRGVIQHIDGSGALLLEPDGYEHTASGTPNITQPLVMVADDFGGLFVGMHYYRSDLDERQFALTRINPDGTSNISSGLGTWIGDGPTAFQMIDDDAGGFYLTYQGSYNNLTIRNYHPDMTSEWSSDLYLECIFDPASSWPRDWSIATDGRGNLRIATTTSILGGWGYPAIQQVEPDRTETWGEWGRALSDVNVRFDHFNVGYPDGRGGTIAWFVNDSGAFVMRVDAFGYHGDPTPVVTEVADIPNDQGGFVLASWDPSYLDDYSHDAVDRYTVWRRDASSSAKALPAPAPEAVASLAADHGLDPGTAETLLAAGWDRVSDTPAAWLPTYACAVPTYFDEMPGVYAQLEVRVVAHGRTQGEIWQSGALAAASIDNLVPGAPSGFVLQVNFEGGNVLSWDEADEPDFAGFRVYRDATPDFVPGPETLVDETVGTVWVDQVWSGETAHYKLSIVDDAGLEGPALPPGLVTDVPSGADAPRFALLPNAPNPFNPATRIRFELPARGPVSLQAGRVVRRLVDGEMPAGVHAVVWDGRDGSGRPAPSGVYLSRLVGAGKAAERRMLLVK